MPPGGIRIVLPSVGDLELWDQHEGEVEVRYEQVREEEGRRLAVLALAVSLEGELDVAEALAELSLAKTGESISYDVATLSSRVEGEGTLLWDLAAGRLHGLSFECVVDSAGDYEWALDAGGTELDVAFRNDVQTTYSIEMAVEEQ